LKYLSDKDVSIDEISSIFGPWFDMNGWKYKAQIDIWRHKKTSKAFTHMF
jgi:hypothetical protein